MFDFYKHLSFATVKVVDPSVAASFTESKLVRQTSGLLGLAGQATQGMRMIRKKPEILKAPHRIEGLDEVEKIYEALDDAPEGGA